MIRIACVAALLALTPLPAIAAPPHWVGSWAASQQVPEPQNALAPADLRDATLRQVVRLSAGGNRIRLRLSNAFGTQPLVIDNVHVAHALSPAGARIDPASDRPVTFNGLASVTIPAGASYLSDPVAMTAAPLAVLAVSLHLPEAPDRQTGHPGSRSTSYLVHGDQSAAADLANAQKVEHWYQPALDQGSAHWEPVVLARGSAVMAQRLECAACLPIRASSAPSAESVRGRGHSCLACEPCCGP